MLSSAPAPSQTTQRFIKFQICAMTLSRIPGKLDRTAAGEAVGANVGQAPQEEAHVAAETSRAPDARHWCFRMADRGEGTASEDTGRWISRQCVGSPLQQYPQFVPQGVERGRLYRTAKSADRVSLGGFS